MASQLLPSCSSPSPTSTYVRRRETSSLADSACPTAIGAVPERAGVGLDAANVVAVRVAVELGQRLQEGRQVSTGRNPKAASVTYQLQRCGPSKG